MRLSTLNQTPLNAVSYGELMDFFADHVFFKFMAQGRSGLSEGVDDAIDNISSWVIARSRETQEPMAELSDALGVQLKRDALKVATDGFIRSGSLGLRTAVQSIHTLLYQAMSDAAKRAAVKATRAPASGKARRARTSP